jgi:hypothetical protein
MERIIRRTSLLFVFVLAGLVVFTFWHYGQFGAHRRSVNFQDPDALDVATNPNDREVARDRRAVASMFFGEREVVPIDPKGQRVPERDGIFVRESIAQELNLKDLEK